LGVGLQGKDNGKSQRPAIAAPSWRGTGWIKKHPWFEADLIPYLQIAVRELLRQ
jgi:hypothetical protein